MGPFMSNLQEGWYPCTTMLLSGSAVFRLLLNFPFLVLLFFVEHLSCPVCFIQEEVCTTRVNQPVVCLRAHWLSPLCRWNQSGCRQSFWGCSHDVAQHSRHRADMPHSCPAVRLRGAWCSSPCCAVRWVRIVPLDRTADSPCRSSVVTWLYLCRDTHESWAYTAGRPRGCRWWKTWRRQRLWRMHQEEPEWHLQKQPTLPRQHTGSRHPGSLYIQTLTAVEKKHSWLHFSTKFFAKQVSVKSVAPKRPTRIVSPWQWEHAHCWSLYVATRAAALLGVTRALSAEWKCRRGRLWHRAARSKRRRGRWCKTEPKAHGWAHASQCSRLCRKVQDYNVPTVPKAPQQTQMHNTTLRLPAGAHVTRRICYLVRKEIE